MKSLYQKWFCEIVISQIHVYLVISKNLFCDIIKSVLKQQMVVDAEILYILWYHEIDYVISILWS